MIFQIDSVTFVDDHIEHHYMIVEGFKNGAASVQAYDMYPNPIGAYVRQDSYFNQLRGFVDPSIGSNAPHVLAKMAEIYNGGGPWANETVFIPAFQVGAEQLERIIKLVDQQKILYRGPNAPKPAEPGLIANEKNLH